jgi:broad specificity phosphatase PhoE
MKSKKFKMKHVLRSLVLALFVVAGSPIPGAAAGPVPAKSAVPVTIILVRHAEKSAESGDVPLSDEGRARASALAALLAPAGVSAVFSSQLTFAQETAAPLAQARKLAPTVIPVRETAQLVAALDKLPAGAVAFVVSHSGTLPELVEKLTGTQPAPVATDDFDRLFVVSRQPGGPAGVVELRYRPFSSAR